MNAVPDAQLLANDLVIGLARFESAMWDSLIAMALIGAITMFAVQILKVVFRPFFLHMRLRSWLLTPANTKPPNDSSEDPPEWLSLVPLTSPRSDGTIETSGMYFSSVLARHPHEAIEVAVMYFSGVSSLLPKDLYIKAIQNRVHEALEHPSDNIEVFLRITNGAASFDQALACLADKMMRQDPNWVARIEKQEGLPADSDGTKGEHPGSGYAAMIAAAQDRVAASAERNLDDLQIKITVQWPVWLKTLAVIVAIAIALAGGIEIAALPVRLWWLLVIFGIVGGYASSIVYEGLTIIGRLRPR